MKKQKPRLPKTLKCYKSKTIRHRKLKSSHHVELIMSTWCELFSFLGLIVLNLEHFKVLGGLVFLLFTLYISIMHLCRKNYFTHFVCRKIWIYLLFVVRKVLYAKVCPLESFQHFFLWIRPTMHCKKIFHYRFWQ